MFFTKGNKIDSWLRSAPPSPFAQLLGQLRSGQMKERLTTLGLTKQEHHIDWHADYKCINIQGRCARQYADIQIEPEAFSVAIDPDEPDDPQEFPLRSADEFYDVVAGLIR